MTVRQLLPALAISMLSAATLHAQGAPGATQAQPSTRATTEVTLTLVDSAARANSKAAVIRIDYGQPHLRGRTLHTPTLVPLDSVWRLGANSATILTTDVSLSIGGQPVPRGMYVLQARPTRSGWTLFVQKNPGGNPFAAPIAYKAENDVARVEMKQTTLSSPVESLSMWLIPAAVAGSMQPGPARGELRISWGTVQLSTEWQAK